MTEDQGPSLVALNQKLDVLIEQTNALLMSNHQRVVDCSLTMAFTRHFFPMGKNPCIRPEDRVAGAITRIAL